MLSRTRKCRYCQRLRLALARASPGLQALHCRCGAAAAWFTLLIVIMSRRYEDTISNTMAASLLCCSIFSLSPPAKDGSACVENGDHDFLSKHSLHNFDFSFVRQFIRQCLPLSFLLTKVGKLTNCSCFGNGCDCDCDCDCDCG